MTSRTLRALLLALVLVAGAVAVPQRAEATVHVDIGFFFQNNEDWHYRTEDKQWVSLNAESCWQRMLIKNGRVQKSKLFMS